MFTYPLLETGQVRRAQRISLGNDRNQIDTGCEALHHFDIKRLQSMSRRANEVQASMDTEIDLVRSAGLLLLQHVGFMLVVQEIDDRLPGVPVVHVITESRSIDNRKAHFTEIC